MASNAKNLAELLNTDSTVAVGDIADGSVSTAKLADDAVTSAKLGASAVDATALASNAVTTAKVADGAVTSVKTTGVSGAAKNVVINGDMQIAQRGTSSTGLGTANGYFTCDRWRHVFNGTAGRLTSSQSTDAPVGFANSLKFACTTADTSIAAGEYFFFSQKIEGQNLKHFAKGTSSAKAFAVSFYVKGNAAATYTLELYDSDNARQCSKSFNVTTSWNRIELIFPADTTGAFNYDENESLVLSWWLHAGTQFTSGTLNSSAFASNTNANRAQSTTSFFDSTSRTFFITGVKLEPVQVTDFEHEDRGVVFQQCRRYYRKNPALQGAMDSGNVNFVCMGFPGNDMRGGGGTGAVIATSNKLHNPGVTFYNLNSSGHGGVYTAYCQLSPGTAWGTRNPGIISQDCLEMDAEL